jgi:hypothetical protein
MEGWGSGTLYLDLEVGGGRRRESADLEGKAREVTCFSLWI